MPAYVLREGEGKAVVLYTRSEDELLCRAELLSWSRKYRPTVTGNLSWANDNRTLFYSKQDPVALRPHRIYQHEIGTDPANDRLLYQEDDEEFSVGVWKTKSGRYVMLVCVQNQSS